MKIESIETKDMTFRFLKEVAILNQNCPGFGTVKDCTVLALKTFLRKIGVPRVSIKKSSFDIPYWKIKLEDMNKHYEVLFENNKTKGSISKLGKFYKEIRFADMLPAYPFVGYYSTRFSNANTKENIIDNVFDSYENVLNEHLSTNVIRTLLYSHAYENELLLKGKKAEEETAIYKIETIFKLIIWGMQAVIVSQNRKALTFKKNGGFLDFKDLNHFERFIFLFLCDFILRARFLVNESFEFKTDYTENNGVLVFDGGGDAISDTLSILHEHFPFMQFIHFRD